MPLPKPNYMVLGAYHPITLLNTIPKVLMACVAKYLVQMSEIHALLLNNHFSCHLARTTSDSLHFMSKFVKDLWCRKEVVSSLFLDIKSVFPSVVLTHLVHNMRTRGVPSQYTSWFKCKESSCRTTLSFDAYKSEPLSLSKGIDQGCLLLCMSFQFYNTDLVDVCNIVNGEEVVRFMDDTLLLAQGNTLNELNGKVKDMMVRHS